MVKKILAVLVVLLIVLVVAAAMQPPEFSVTRSATIAAPPATVFAQVDDFHRWPAWSPWAKLDPTMKITYGGAPAGPGATYAWVGNSKVGAGDMSIIESHPTDMVKIALNFVKPFVGHDTTVFTFQPSGNQTTVTWTMSGQKNFVAKALGMFMSMDKMIGGDFERGLAQMKTVSEAAPK